MSGGPVTGALGTRLGNRGDMPLLGCQEVPMPAQRFALLIVFVIAAGGLTIALVWALGVSLTWVALAAAILALVVRFLA